MELSRSDDIYAISFTPENLFIPQMTLPSPLLFFSDSHERQSHKLTLNLINESLLFWFSVSVTLSVKHSNPRYSIFQNQIKSYVPLYLFNLVK